MPVRPTLVTATIEFITCMVAIIDIYDSIADVYEEISGDLLTRLDSLVAIANDDAFVKVFVSHLSVSCFLHPG